MYLLVKDCSDVDFLWYLGKQQVSKLGLAVDHLVTQINLAFEGQRKLSATEVGGVTV